MSGTCACGATWTGKRIEHCTACHETFTGTGSGDMHRVGPYAPLERRCLSAEEMRDRGMAANSRGHWTTGRASPWATPPESEAPGRPRSDAEPPPVQPPHRDAARPAERRRAP
jgi:hypothetical protein